MASLKKDTKKRVARVGRQRVVQGRRTASNSAGASRNRSSVRRKNEPVIDVPRGCECVCGNHAGMADMVPVAYLIERDGKQMKVCTRCDLSSDKKLALLVTAAMPSKPYFDYDALGAFCLIGELGEAWEFGQ